MNCAVCYKNTCHTTCLYEYTFADKDIVDFTGKQNVKAKTTGDVLLLRKARHKIDVTSAAQI